MYIMNNQEGRHTANKYKRQALSLDKSVTNSKFSAFSVMALVPPLLFYSGCTEIKRSL